MNKILFRYPDEFKEDLNAVVRMNYKHKINPALVDCVEIVARLIKVLKPFTSKNLSWYYSDKNKINDLIKQIEKISKKRAIEKDIKNLDLKK